MKNKEELNSLKEVEILGKKYAEKNDEELEQVFGGMSHEDFQTLNVGDRVRFIAGPHINKCGTVSRIRSLILRNVKIDAIIRIDDGTEANAIFSEIERI